MDRASTSRTRVIWSSLFLVGFAMIVLAITLTPEPVDKGDQPTIARVLDALHRRGIPDWFDYAALEFSANIVLFAPLTFLIVLVLPLRRWWLALVIGPVLSIGIELTQLTTFADRFATVEDVIANSIGAVVGAGLGAGVRVAVQRRARRRSQRQEQGASTGSVTARTSATSQM